MRMALPVRGASPPLTQPGRSGPARSTDRTPVPHPNWAGERATWRPLAFDVPTAGGQDGRGTPDAAAESAPVPRRISAPDLRRSGLQPLATVDRGIALRSVQTEGRRRRGRPRGPGALAVAVHEARRRLRDALAVLFNVAPRRRPAVPVDRDYRDLVEHASDIVFTLDRAGRFVSVNAAGPRLTGFSRAQLHGRPLSELTSIEDAARVRTILRCITAGEPFAVFEVTIPTRSQQRLTLEIHAWSLRRPGRAPAIQGIARDVTERRFREAQYRHAALHDALTGLPNRLLLYDRLQQSVAAAGREQRQLALLLLDLDRFKAVNDAHGHLAGDQLLQQVGRRLQCAVRGSDTVARLGGDEFAVLLPGTGSADAELAGARLLQALDAPFMIDGRRISIAASAGAAVYPLHGVCAEALLRCADLAMYRAKRSGGGLVVYQAPAATAGA